MLDGSEGVLRKTELSIASMGTCRVFVPTSCLVPAPLLPRVGDWAPRGNYVVPVGVLDSVVLHDGAMSLRKYCGWNVNGRLTPAALDSILVFVMLTCARFG